MTPRPEERLDHTAPTRRRGPAIRYAHAPYPWDARIDVRSSRPATHYAALIGQTLRYGMPARRRFGRLWAAVGRRGIPEAVLARAVRLLPLEERPEIDILLAAVVERWAELARRSTGLPAAPPELTALGLARSVGLTVFVFGETPHPLVVVKVAAGGADRLEREMAALREAEAAAMAPKDLGALGDARVQEGVPGAPLRVEPMTPERAERLRWSPEHEELVAGLKRLASTTAKAGPPQTLPDRVERALSYPGLGGRARTLLAAAWRDVRGMDVSALRHCDSSAQNCLYADGRLTGIVDWELAESHGAPGFDVWNSALSYIEHGLGLVEWSQDLAVEALERSWDSSPFWSRARAAAREVASIAGARGDLLDPLELVFFGSRIGDRLALPGVPRGTGVATSARMCETAAGARR